MLRLIYILSRLYFLFHNLAITGLWRFNYPFHNHVNLWFHYAAPITHTATVTIDWFAFITSFTCSIWRPPFSMPTSVFSIEGTFRLYSCIYSRFTMFANLLCSSCEGENTSASRVLHRICVVNTVKIPICALLAILEIQENRLLVPAV